MKKYLIPALAAACLGMAPGAFAHDTRAFVGADFGRSNVGVSATSRHSHPALRTSAHRDHRHDFRRNDRRGHHFDRNHRGHHYGWRHRHHVRHDHRYCH
jgi:hypothetical protein